MELKKDSQQLSLHLSCQVLPGPLVVLEAPHVLSLLDYPKKRKTIETRKILKETKKRAETVQKKIQIQKDVFRIFRLHLECLLISLHTSWGIIGLPVPEEVRTRRTSSHCVPSQVHITSASLIWSQCERLVWESPTKCCYRKWNVISGDSLVLLLVQPVPPLPVHHARPGNNQNTRKLEYFKDTLLLTHLQKTDVLTSPVSLETPSVQQYLGHLWHPESLQSSVTVSCKYLSHHLMMVLLRIVIVAQYLWTTDAFLAVGTW